MANRRIELSPEDFERARASGAKSVRALAARLGVHRSVVERHLGKTRTAEEFRETARFVRAPRRESAAGTWDIEKIRAAVLSQQRGDFKLAVQLAAASLRDDAISISKRNRLAPIDAIGTRLDPHNSTRGASVQRRASDCVKVARTTLKSIHSTLVDHGIAIGYLEHDTDGQYIEFELTQWPLEHVKWNESREVLETAVRDGGPRETIVHGDGRWVVFVKFRDTPWCAPDACVIPAGLCWGMHAHGITDWAAASLAHGQSKVHGELPQGVTLQGANGQLTPEAAAFLAMLEGLVSGDKGAAIRPHGSKLDFLANGSSAWQVFSELALNREKAAARIYNGTDAFLGSVGGAPGVDIAELFNISSTIIQSDLSALTSAINSGVYVPWTAINYGDSSYAPRLAFNVPDPDAERTSAQQATARERLHAEIKRMKDSAMIVTQEIVDAIARELGVTRNIPQLAPVAERSVPIALAPTDIARVIRVREARASQGLPPLGDARDDMFISELEQSAAPAPPPPAPAPKP